MSPSLPPFEALPLDKHGPPGNAWGLFGEKDEMGRLNLLTPETVKEAAKEIKEGVRVSLDWHLSKPAHPFFNRQAFYHHVQSKAPRTVNDDILLFNTQCSTQWDGFRHFGNSSSSPTGGIPCNVSSGRSLCLMQDTRRLRSSIMASPRMT
jgi:hypothetical protein